MRQIRGLPANLAEAMASYSAVAEGEIPAPNCDARLAWPRGKTDRIRHLFEPAAGQWGLPPPGTKTRLSPPIVPEPVPCRLEPSCFHTGR